VAPLTPRPVAEAVPTFWVGLAVVSTLMLAPYVILDEERAGALMVGVCALALAYIGWRLATAPIALEGDCDPRSEHMRERAERHQKVGMCAVIAIGSIFVFASFENANLAVVLPLQRLFVPLSMCLWAGLWAWVALYSRHLDRLSNSAS
ncbi:MAG: hypothetical protein WBD74_15260, partial [Candidatus Aquilonibacter sp.]